MFNHEVPQGVCVVKWMHQLSNAACENKLCFIFQTSNIYIAHQENNKIIHLIKGGTKIIPLKHVCGPSHSDSPPTEEWRANLQGTLFLKRLHFTWQLGSSTHGSDGAGFITTTTTQIIL